MAHLLLLQQVSTVYIAYAPSMIAVYAIMKTGSSHMTVYNIKAAYFC